MTWPIAAFASVANQRASFSWMPLSHKASDGHLTPMLPSSPQSLSSSTVTCTVAASSRPCSRELAFLQARGSLIIGSDCRAYHAGMTLCIYAAQRTLPAYCAASGAECSRTRRLSQWEIPSCATPTMHSCKSRFHVWHFTRESSKLLKYHMRGCKLSRLLPHDCWSMDTSKIRAQQHPHGTLDCTLIGRLLQI